MWEHLDELRRQIEEDYMMDIAALERLARHFRGARATASASGAFTVKSVPPAPPALTSDVPERQPDELDGSLRAMFTKHR